MSAIKVGDRLKYTSNLPYGKERSIHRVVRVVEVTAVFPAACDWRTVDIVEESGRPPWMTRESVLAVTGGVMLRFIDDPRGGFERLP